jgi:hypothetical protein
MKKFSRTIFVVLFAFACQVPARADTVELDLFSIGCQHTYDINSQYWQTNFDLGVAFTQISHVYMDWSGGITAGLAIDYDNPNEPFPLDVGIGATLWSSPSWRHISIYDGEATYPSPEIFDRLSEFVDGSMPWSELFDGQGTIAMGYEELVSGFEWEYVEHGSIALDSATLIVEGTIVPEPATILFLAAGIIGLRIRKRKN